ncbi:hypothetical protein BRADI_3g06917v3 [Brachypodium distachyon]|uniref:Uncharacterized protein n=1 Tax=Brachypodium distachyon TaxID=15368 RepID=A0A2K2CVN6_BRADI|nr:hypothetical protein BRADI_3g06917v3 [Brachypodium distachyon]
MGMSDRSVAEVLAEWFGGSATDSGKELVGGGISRRERMHSGGDTSCYRRGSLGLEATQRRNNGAVAGSGQYGAEERGRRGKRCFVPAQQGDASGRRLTGDNAAGALWAAAEEAAGGGTLAERRRGDRRMAREKMREKKKKAELAPAVFPSCLFGRCGAATQPRARPAAAAHPRARAAAKPCTRIRLSIPVSVIREKDAKPPMGKTKMTSSGVRAARLRGRRRRSPFASWCRVPTLSFSLSPRLLLRSAVTACLAHMAVTCCPSFIKAQAEPHI